MASPHPLPHTRVTTVALPPAAARFVARAIDRLAVAETAGSGEGFGVRCSFGAKPRPGCGRGRGGGYADGCTDSAPKE